MGSRIRAHIRSNVVGYVALFFALSMGTAYATHPGGANTISSVDIVDGEVKNKDLAADAVGSGKIADRQVKNADLSIGASSSNTIADRGIKGIDVALDTLSGEHIADGSLGTDELAGSIPAARVTHTTSQSIHAETALTALSFNTERYDTANMHDPASDTELTAPVDGIYAITAQVAWEGNSTGHRLVGFRVDGSRFIAFERVQPVSQGTNQEVTTQAHLQAGEAVQAVVSQTNSTDAALDIFALPEWTPEFSMTWLAPGP
ncbi:MAG: hypothetical protein ACRDGV_04645 [Candidatus Limnocylindria bacterium]